MRLSKPFPLPEEPPVVPERLAERITRYLLHTTKIVIQLAERDGWKVINTVHLEGNEDAVDVYTLVKSAADYYCDDVGRNGKFRAQMHRHPPGQAEARHSATFLVREAYDDNDDSERSPAAVDDADSRREQAGGWRELVDQQYRLIDSMARYNDRSTDRVLEQSKQTIGGLAPVGGILQDFAGMYREGLRAKADAVRELGDMSVQHQLAQAKLNDSGKFWETFGPAVQLAIVHAQRHVMGLGGPPMRALPRASTTTPNAMPQATPVAAAAPPAGPPSPPPSPQAAAPPSPPSNLHGLTVALLDALGPEGVVRLTLVLDDAQRQHLAAVASARDDDTTAVAIVGLMQALAANPSTILELQATLTPEQAAAFQQLAMLAQQHNQQRVAPATVSQGTATEPSPHESETAPPVSGDAASPEKE
ncbi:MAG: hypothetical protein K0V04_15570 [Deltaproteobacteria bacterium]|nr:hypothetical protein [Deltaproteobacteria bacterium]